MWITTAARLLRFNQEELLHASLEDSGIREFGLADGLQSVEGVRRSQSVVTDPLGRVWFSMGRGISVTNPARSLSGAPAIAQIENASADGSPLDLRAVPSHSCVQPAHRPSTSPASASPSPSASASATSSTASIATGAPPLQPAKPSTPTSTPAPTSSVSSPPTVTVSGIALKRLPALSSSPLFGRPGGFAFFVSSPSWPLSYSPSAYACCR